MRQHQAPSGSITIATITIGSVPLTPDDDFPKGFYVRRIQGELWLRGHRYATIYAKYDRVHNSSKGVIINV